MAGMGVVLGTLYTSIAITALFGPPIVGAIIDHTGSYRIGILFTIATTFAGFLVLLLLKPRKVSAGESEMRPALAHSEGNAHGHNSYRGCRLGKDHGRTPAGHAPRLRSSTTGTIFIRHAIARR